MIHLASIPRCGSTYLLRSIAGLRQAGFTPKGTEEKYGIRKTHAPPPDSIAPGDRAIFLFGSVPHAVVSTMEWRHDPNHFANCGVDDYDPDADLLSEDLLGYADLYEAWLEAPFPVLFVRYETLYYPLTRRVIKKHLGREVAWLPWRPRRTVVSERQRRRVAEAYAPLVKRVAEAPAFFFAGETGGVAA